MAITGRINSVACACGYGPGGLMVELQRFEDGQYFYCEVWVDNHIARIINHAPAGQRIDFSAKLENGEYVKVHATN